MHGLPPCSPKTVGKFGRLAVRPVRFDRLTNVLPILTPIAAVGLVLTMVGALAVHIPRKETMAAVGNVVLLVMSAFVACGRFVVVSL